MKNRERDTQMEALLRMALTGEHRPPSSACLDAEVLAAWADGGLAGLERAAAEAHAAGCAQCQAMMASMVRSLPADAALDAARSPLRRWMMFLTPAMAGAVAVVVWIAVGRNADRQLATPIASAPAATTADRSVAAPPVELPAEPAPPSSSAATPQQAPKASARRVDELRKAPSPEVLGETVQVASERDSAAAVVTTDPANRMEVKDRKTEFATATPPPAAAEPLPRAADARGYIPPQQQANQAPNQQANQQASQQANQQAPGMLDARIAAGRGGREETQLAAAQAARSFLSPQTIVAPNGVTRWRVGGGSRIEYSADSGQTWATQYDAGAGVALVAGTAVSATVAWIVGRDGAVFVTADGRTWTRTAVPGAPDLTAVTAADALAATVLTADGRRFTTADGGRTWK